jgi:hypothetical protein
MTVDVLIDTYGHYHPDFQADAAEKIAKKHVATKASKTILRTGENKARMPRHHPTVSPQKSRKETGTLASERDGRARGSAALQLAHLVRDEGVAGSNPATPTRKGTQR